MRKHFVAGLLVSAAVIGLPAVTEAAPKTGCPAGSSGWQLLSIDATAETVYAGLIEDPYGSEEALAAALRGYDRNGDGRNGDGYLCLLEQWGPERNPNSRWYPITLFLVVDNNANARK